MPPFHAAPPTSQTLAAVSVDQCAAVPVRTALLLLPVSAGVVHTSPAPVPHRIQRSAP